MSQRCNIQHYAPLPAPEEPLELVKIREITTPFDVPATRDKTDAETHLRDDKLLRQNGGDARRPRTRTALHINQSRVTRFKGGGVRGVRGERTEGEVGV